MNSPAAAHGAREMGGTAPDGALPAAPHSPDSRDGQVYIMPSDVALAVEVALATGRPLLLRGEPGSGKSSLAAYVARERGWRYYEHVVTSRSKADDLLWTYDHVRRLSDAQVREPGTDLDDQRYVTPGPLWWAFDPVSARGGQGGRPLRPDAFAEVNAERPEPHAVVLVDEIDKADPDLPNSLLVPLGSHRFTVTETGETVRKRVSAEDPEARNPEDRNPENEEPEDEEPEADEEPEGGPLRHLVIITTNEERELPQAFLRRCVIASLPEPDAARLVEIAEAHFRSDYQEFGPADEELARELAEEIEQARAEARALAIRPPSTAEFLDALRACRALGIGVADDRWPLLKSLTLLKPQQPGG
ncbi:AAA family ATPase [Streptomyces yaizuensis]|uniref:MoxR family ATPase n=1 Tax=Streptomyces yaizuensis TaxID=2989713 RepID=A0ABQ5NZN0_9ACTN|nr:MoxR family ATPase [Streptomyces sp. YSPA8]GLF95421.1 MoxR family ATPase [Streptomyces sp. YSPA8]